MKIIKIQDRTAELINELFLVWEKSVKATHLFLSSQEIEKIAAFVPSVLLEVPHLVVAAEDGGTPVAFMGICGKMLEMLFVTPEARGTGIGKQLIHFGIQEYSINKLGVNEQNPLAKGFYEHMGFRVYKRTETDEQGNPYPILYMKRIK